MVLFLVTSLVDEKGTTEAYLQILPVLRSLGDFWITSFDFNLIGEKNQLAADVIKLMKRYPDRRTIHSPDVVIDFRSVEEIYIYPLDKVKVTVYGLVFRRRSQRYICIFRSSPTTPAANSFSKVKQAIAKSTRARLVSTGQWPHLLAQPWNEMRSD